MIKLLTTARDSDSDPERLAAYARARSELAKLDRAGVIHLPRTAQAALDAAGRGRCPPRMFAPAHPGYRKPMHAGESLSKERRT